MERQRQNLKKDNFLIPPVSTKLSQKTETDKKYIQLIQSTLKQKKIHSTNTNYTQLIQTIH